MSEALMLETEAVIEPLPSLETTTLAGAEPYYRFGEIEVDVRTRTVTCSGVDLRLGSRAFDLLVVLLRMRGTVADKQYIMHEVWPTTTVDDSNLRFQMTCLRRALGPHCDVIKTIPGRGYFFVGATVSEMNPGFPGQVTDRSHKTSCRDAIQGPATVAIVEDDESVRDALDALLRSFGFVVKAFETPQDFFEAGPLAAECLILDIWLPGKSGLDVQAELKAAGAEVPIIFISGQADIHMSVKAMKAGAVEFLTKPVRHEEILGAVQNAVETTRNRAGSADAIGMAPQAYRSRGIDHGLASA